MAAMTLKGIFEREVARLGVLVLHGDDGRDAHASVGKRYVMLPGGENDTATYAAGLHELGHLEDAPTDDERTARLASTLAPVVPPYMYARVVHAERKAWDWAQTVCAREENARELLDLLAPEREVTLGTYTAGETRNLVKWNREVDRTYREALKIAEAMAPREAGANDVKATARQVAEEATEIMVMLTATSRAAEASATGHTGCGECDTCKERKARDERAAAKYEEACKQTGRRAE